MTSHNLPIADDAADLVAGFMSFHDRLEPAVAESDGHFAGPDESTLILVHAINSASEIIKGEARSLMILTRESGYASPIARPIGSW